MLVLACRRGAGSGSPSEPAEGPVAELPSFEEEPAPVPLDLDPDPLPEGVVAAVDGEPIFAAELERLVQTAPPAEDPAAARAGLLLQLVERRLLRAKADQMDVRATEEEVQRAIDGVAVTNGLTVEQLEQEVVKGGWTWDDYREEIVAQVLELKVLNLNGVYDSGPQDPEAVEALRARFVGCMRARAEVQVADRSIQLPDNPFSRLTEIAELRFTGDMALPEDELRSVAMEAAKSRMRLCDALISAELAVQELYFERGYLESRVKIPWPSETTTPALVEIQVGAGRPHVIGKISFDQSAAPRARRLDAKELQKRVAAFVAEGDVAAMSAMRAASAEMTRAFEQGGLGTVEATVDRKEEKTSVRVNITYRLLGSEV